MKSLKEFIKESIESSYTNAKFFDLNLSKFKKSAGKVIAAANKDGLYLESTESGYKIKIYKTSKVSSLIHALNSIIEVNKSNKELFSDIESLTNELQEIIEFTAFKEDDGDSTDAENGEEGEEE